MGKAPKLLPLIMTAIDMVERFIKAKGKAKQDAAMQMIDTLIVNLESPLEREVINQDHVKSGVKNVIDAIVALQNAIESARNPQPEHTNNG